MVLLAHAHFMQSLGPFKLFTLSQFWGFLGSVSQVLINKCLLPDHLAAALLGTAAFHWAATDAQSLTSPKLLAEWYWAIHVGCWVSWGDRAYSLFIYTLHSLHRAQAWVSWGLETNPHADFLPPRIDHALHKPRWCHLHRWYVPTGGPNIDPGNAEIIYKWFSKCVYGDSWNKQSHLQLRVQRQDSSLRRGTIKEIFLSLTANRILSVLSP